MPKTQAWGSGVNTVYWSAYPGNIVYRDGTSPIPTANVAANGQRPLRFHSCTANSLVNGVAEINYGGQGVGTIHPNATPGASFRFQCRNTGGSMQVGLSTIDGGTVVDGGDGDTRTGSIPGSMQWSGVPSAPRTPAATSPLPGQARVTWTAPADDGGEPVIGYRLQRATNAAFSTGVTNFELGNVLTYTDTSAVPGTTYYYRVFAKNSTSNSAGTTSSAGATVSVRVLAGGRRYDGSAEVATTAAMLWDGTQEVPLTTAVRWDGTQEVSLT